MLVRFFNELGSEDVYEQGFPSRWMYAENKLRELNGSRELDIALESSLDPRNYFETEFDLNVVVSYLNRYLKFDGIEIVKKGELYKVKNLYASEISISESVEVVFGEEYINQQIDKCESRIRDGDYDGAITSARSFIETILLEISKKIYGSPIKYDGDLLKLFKETQKLLNLSPSRQDITDALRQVLVGLNSIINGLASMRNKMGDAHSKTYKPEKHHATLAENAAKTLAVFIFETYQYQKEKGSINPKG